MAKTDDEDLGVDRKVREKKTRNKSFDLGNW